MNVWPIKKIGDIVDFSSGLWTGKRDPLKSVRVLRNTNFRSSGLLDFDNVAEIEVEIKQLESRLLILGDILLEKSGGGPGQPVGRVVYFDKQDHDYSFSNFTCRLRAKNQTELDSKYLWLFLYFQYLSGITERIQKQTTGIRNLMMPEYKSLEIPLPPLEIQKKIVKKIEELFAKIDQAQSLRDTSVKNTNDLVSATLSKIFQDGRLKRWKEKALGEICEIARGGSPRPIKDYLTRAEDGINWIKISDATNSTKYIYKTREKIKKEGLKKSRLVKPGDFILTNSMSFGRPYIMKTMGAIHDGWLLLRPNISFTEEYLYYFLSSNEIYKQFTNLAGGAVVQNLNSELVRSVKILIPPLDEQKKIVAMLDALTGKVRELQALQTETAKDLTALKQSILHQAFQGELFNSNEALD